MKIIFDSYKEKEKWINILALIGKDDLTPSQVKEDLDPLYIAASGADIAGHHGKKCQVQDPIAVARDRFQEAIAEMPPQEPLAGVQVRYEYNENAPTIGQRVAQYLGTPDVPDAENERYVERGWNDIQQAGGLD